jgi:hypothetical protein
MPPFADNTDNTGPTLATSAPLNDVVVLPAPGSKIYALTLSSGVPAGMIIPARTFIPSARALEASIKVGLGLLVDVSNPNAAIRFDNSINSFVLN